MWKYFVLGLLVLSVSSCAPRYSVFEPLDLEVDPIVEYYSDMYFDYSIIRSFAVVPIRLLTNESYDNYNILAESSIGFNIRNILETSGYMFSDNPDVVVLYLYSNKYEQSYIPPQQYTSFIYVPSKQITTSTDFSGNINSFTNWGTFRGTATSTTTLPAKIVPYTYTKPGRTVGYYYPGVNIWIYDLRSEKVIWQGLAVGTSKNSDIRVSSQLLLMKLLSNFPTARQLSIEPSTGMIGIGIRILTFDGNAYFPVIVNVDKNLPGYRAGLRVGDIIMEIDGVPTRNKPMSYVGKLLAGDANTPVTFIIYRDGKTQQFSVVRVQKN